MSNYFQPYSAWTDAANYGQGFGQAISEALLQLPRQRAAMAIQQQQQAREAQKFPLEQQLLQAQIANAQAKPEYEQALLGQREQTIQAQAARLQEAQRVHDMQAGWEQERNQNTAERNQWQQAAATSKQEATEAQAKLTQAQKDREEYDKTHKMSSAKELEAKTQLAHEIGGSMVPAGTQLNLAKMLPLLALANANVPQIMQEAQQVPELTTNNWLGLHSPTVRTNAMNFLPPEVSAGGGPAIGGVGNAKVVTPEIAASFLKAAGGDRNAARAMAKQAGYTF